MSYAGIGKGPADGHAAMRDKYTRRIEVGLCAGEARAKLRAVCRVVYGGLEGTTSSSRRISCISSPPTTTRLKDHASPIVVVDSVCGGIDVLHPLGNV
ncbi:hypothetical protein MRX96_000691 [Rhipicephalus microplus]